jgi:hypothetical protein
MWCSSRIVTLGIFTSCLAIAIPLSHAVPVTIVDTAQNLHFDTKKPIPSPQEGEAFYGQDADYKGNPPAYRDNGDGTISDLQTGLMWSKACHPQKVSLEEARSAATEMDLGGHRDWRVPTIQELYSLIDFRGYTGFAGGNHDLQSSPIPKNAIPFINTDYFDFLYGDTHAGERFIDAQWLTSTEYVSTTMGGARTLFGVNFADGRIKGYGYSHPSSRRPEKKFYVRYVRGPKYLESGNDRFEDKGDGTIIDQATGLTWMKNDSGKGMTWEEALAYAESLELAGHDDWRLPDAKELHSIVDYSRSPDTTDSPAIDPLFETSSIKNEAGEKDYPFFWTSTTHLDGPTPGHNAAYLTFGRGIGQMHGQVMDVHGAGAQRSDPKVGSARIGRGPQGDAVRVLNYVRCVRGKCPSDYSGSPSKGDYPDTIRVGDKSYRPDKIDWNARPPSGFSPGKEEGPGRGGKDGPSGGDGGERFIKRLDKDGDNKVSKKEFDGPSHHFGQFDRNNDGYITADEAPTGPPPSRRPDNNRPPGD